MADCSCMNSQCPSSDFDSIGIGIDETNGRFGEVSIKVCKKCKRKWLHYYVSYEAFSASGRWYRGLISDEVAQSVAPAMAVEILEGLEWHFYGGSYFQTVGRKGSGLIDGGL